MIPNNKGFLLLEAMIAVVILGLVLVISIQAVGQCMHVGAQASYLTRAAAYSQRVLAALEFEPEAAANMNGGVFSAEKSAGTEDEYTTCTTAKIVWTQQGARIESPLVLGKLRKKDE